MSQPHLADFEQSQLAQNADNLCISQCERMNDSAYIKFKMSVGGMELIFKS